MVVVQISEAEFGVFPHSTLLAGVQEFAREGGPEVDVVRAAGPLEVGLSLVVVDGAVAAAAVVHPTAARLRHRVRYPRGCHGQHVGRLSCTYK